MNLHEHFLPDDLLKACKEYKSLKDCLKIVTKSIKKGDVEHAKHYSVDMLRSLHELSKLADRKTVLDKHWYLIKGLPTDVHLKIMSDIRGEEVVGEN